MMKLPNLGSLWMLVAALGFAIMGALVKIGSAKFSAAELVFYRSIFGLISTYLYVLLNNLSIKSPVIWQQMSRALMGLVSLALFFYAITKLHLATAITLNYTSPLFLALLMPFLLHEKPNKILYLAIFMGFVGMVFLLKPTISSQNWLAGTLGLISGMGAAIGYIHVKKLANANEPDWRTVFYFTLVSTIGSVLWMLVHSFQTVSWGDVPVLLGLGVSATIAQLALTRAYRTGNTLTVASLAYVTVVLASVFGSLFWRETLSNSEWIAIVLIIAGGLVSVRFSTNIKSQNIAV